MVCRYARSMYVGKGSKVMARKRSRPRELASRPARRHSPLNTWAWSNGGQEERRCVLTYIQTQRTNICMKATHTTQARTTTRSPHFQVRPRPVLFRTGRLRSEPPRRQSRRQCMQKRSAENSPRNPGATLAATGQRKIGDACPDCRPSSRERGRVQRRAVLTRSLVLRRRGVHHACTYV